MSSVHQPISFTPGEEAWSFGRSVQRPISILRFGAAATSFPSADKVQHIGSSTAIYPTSVCVRSAAVCPKSVDQRSCFEPFLLIEHDPRYNNELFIRAYRNNIKAFACRIRYLYDCTGTQTSKFNSLPKRQKRKIRIKNKTTK